MAKSNPTVSIKVYTVLNSKLHIEMFSNEQSLSQTSIADITGWTQRESSRYRLSEARGYRCPTQGHEV